MAETKKIKPAAIPEGTEKPAAPEVTKEEPKTEHLSKKLFIGTIKNPKKFQTIYEVASALVDDVMLRIDKEGIKIRAIDSAHVGFLLVDMPKAFFSKFRTNEDLEWNVSIIDVTKILKRSKSTDILEISHHEDDPNNLVFKIITGKRSRTFKLSQKSSIDGGMNTEVSDDGRKLEDVLNDFEAKVREACLGQFVLETDFLEDLIKDAQIVSDLIFIDIEPTKDSLCFSAVEVGSANVTELSLKEKEHVLSAKVVDTCHGKYALSYLENILKLKAVVEAYSLSLAFDGPLLVETKFLKDEETLQIGNPGSLRFILAPRIEQEEITPEQLEEDLEKEKPKKKPKKSKKVKTASAEDSAEAVDAEADADTELESEDVDKILSESE